MQSTDEQKYLRSLLTLMKRTNSGLPSIHAIKSKCALSSMQLYRKVGLLALSWLLTYRMRSRTCLC